MRKLLFSMRLGQPRELNGNLNVPEYLKERFAKLEPDNDLAEDMGKYILCFNEGWGYPMGAHEYWNSIPVMNKKEALEFLREAVKVENEEELH